jgi:DNA excision repair protein ERCC-3
VTDLEVTAGNAYATVSGRAEQWARDYLAVVDPYDPTVRSDLVDAHGLFPSGFVRPLLEAARSAGKHVHLNDVRDPPAEVGRRVQMGSWLRDDQADAAKVARSRARGIVSMPTGAGKTEVMVAVAQATAIKWLVLVDTKDLLHQWAARYLARTGETAGRVGDGHHDVRRVTVATFQALYGSDLVREFEGVLVDEVQVLAAPENFRVVMAMDRAYWRLGFSATPLARTDGRDYMAVGALGPVIVAVSDRAAVEAGVVAEADVRFIRFRHPRTTGAFQDVYEAAVVLREERNQLIARVVSSAELCPRPCLVFVKTVRHGPILMKLIKAMGSRVDFVSGEDAVGARRAAVGALERGQIDVLVTSKIFNKGIDIPIIGSGMNAAAGASEIDAAQRLGRLRRVSEGKGAVVYWDVLDENQRTLADHARSRMAAYTERKIPLSIWRDDGAQVLKDHR